MRSLLTRRLPPNQVARQEAETNEIIGWFASGHVIEVRTRTVFDDEPCYYLGEFHRPSRTGKSVSRYQMLKVVRDDRLMTAWVYLGPRQAFAQDEFQIPGGEMYEGRGRVWHTVGELREIADELRGRKPRQEQEPMDLQSGFRRFAEEQVRRQRHQSTFGAGVHLQRE